MTESESLPENAPHDPGYQEFLTLKRDCEALTGKLSAFKSILEDFAGLDHKAEPRPVEEVWQQHRDLTGSICNDLALRRLRLGTGVLVWRMFDPMALRVAWVSREQPPGAIEDWTPFQGRSLDFFCATCTSSHDAGDAIRVLGRAIADTKRFPYTEDLTDGRTFVIPPSDFIPRVEVFGSRVLDVEARTGTRLKNYGNPLEYLRAYATFTACPREVPFQDYCEHCYPGLVQPQGPERASWVRESTAREAETVGSAQAEEAWVPMDHLIDDYFKKMRPYIDMPENERGQPADRDVIRKRIQRLEIQKTGTTKSTKYWLPDALRKINDAVEKAKLADERE